MSGNDFPKVGINTAALVAHIEDLLTKARWEADKGVRMGAVNWGDLGVADVEYRLSMLNPNEAPYCMVLVEEAAPGCELQGWLHSQLDKARFPNTFIECEW